MEDAITCGHRHAAVVGGRYRLEQVLRSGPARCEHRAHDELLRRTVTTVIAAPASGEPLPDAPTLPDSARTEHSPGLAEVYDGGGEGGVLYLVVPRVEGTCLADDLAEGPLSVTEVRVLGVRIARVLLPVHRHGRAHGALGAETVTRGPSGVTVAGLGVREWLHRWAHQRYDPPHPAPEQRGPDPSISPATDVYALGRLLGVAAGRLPRSEPLRAALRAMTRTDPAARPTTREVIDLLEGRALPGAEVQQPGPGRALAGTLCAVALAGALALAGFVAHTAPSGLLGGATLGWPAPPSPVVDRPTETPPAGAGATDDREGRGSGNAVAVTPAWVTATLHASTGTPVPSAAAVRTSSGRAGDAASSGTATPSTATDDAPPDSATHHASPHTVAGVPRTADPSTPTHPRRSLSATNPPRSVAPTTAHRATGLLSATGRTGRRTDPTRTSSRTDLSRTSSRTVPTTADAHPTADDPTSSAQAAADPTRGVPTGRGTSTGD